MSRALLILALVACALVAAEAQACRDHPDRQCRPRKLCKYGYIRGQCPGITYCCNPAPGSSSSAAPTQSLRPKPRPDSWASNGIPTIDRNGPGVKSPVMVTVSQEAIHYFEDTLLPMVLKGKVRISSVVAYSCCLSPSLLSLSLPLFLCSRCIGNARPGLPLLYRRMSLCSTNDVSMYHHSSLTRVTSLSLSLSSRSLVTVRFLSIENCWQELH
eukprot:TRINITY_DN572_c2_g1_i2.p1 TRINITY_DN572_c2_g1~~TRINITY_DN572_c2_g1_i2.p1  ORF type:complete len:214 (-),score=21.93 TRINITY_DN572_c2_g1_i2:295-936(-)